MDKSQENAQISNGSKLALSHNSEKPAMIIKTSPCIDTGCPLSRTLQMHAVCRRLLQKITSLYTNVIYQSGLWTQTECLPTMAKREIQQI